MFFHNRFDRHTWNAKNYTDMDEINRALYEHNIRSKKIAAIHPIGIAEELRSGEGFHLLRHELHEQGSPFWDQTAIDYAENKYPQLRSTMVRCAVSLEEPTIIVFDDGSTMELHPYAGEGLKLSFDQLPADMLDGTNDSNFDAHQLFGILEGESITGCCGWQDTQERLDRSDFHTITTRSYQFWLAGFYGLTLTEKHGNLYKLELTNQRCFVGHHRNAAARISFDNYMRAAKPIKQIRITASNGLSDGFAMMPTHWDPKEFWPVDYEAGCKEEMISLWEDDAYAYLLYFLNKHLSEHYPDWVWGDWEEHEESEDDISYNKVISYDVLRAILSDIRETVHLLKTDYDDLQLDGVKAMFDPCSFDRMFLYEKPMPEYSQVMQENVNVVIHFYERFCWCIENMMQNNPEYEFVSIWGP